MSKETVSVVIPYYRARGTIARAVESVLGQTAPPKEILIVDDGCPEDAVAATQQFGSSVTLIRKPNGGTASARNLGIDHAQGAWIAFLDADDYWEPAKLERQLAFSEGAGVVGSMWFTETDDRPRSVAKIANPAFFGTTFRPGDLKAFQVAMNLWTSSLLVRRRVLGEKRFVSGLEPAEDRDLWIRVVASTAVHLVPEPLATYCQLPESLSNSDSNRDCASMLKVVHRHAALLGAKGVREQEAAIYRRWAGSHLARGKPRSAMGPAARRLVIQPGSPQAWWIMCKSLALSVLH
ncbi:MAG: glycosyltransferase family 2 protein [Candidatus Acidiferrum sp.]|jgi:glycosyltransferase involved in cell wall biosynthesis